MSIGATNSNPVLMKILAGQKNETAISPESLVQLLAKEGGELNSLQQSNDPLSSPASLIQEETELDSELNFEQLMNSLKNESPNKEIPLKKSEKIFSNKTQIPSDLNQNAVLNFMKENSEEISPDLVLEKENERSFFPNSGTSKKVKNDFLPNDTSETSKRSFFSPEITFENTATQATRSPSPSPSPSPDVKFFKNSEVLKTEVLNSPPIISTQGELISLGQPSASAVAKETASELISPDSLEMDLSPTAPVAIQNKKTISNIYLKNSEDLTSSNLPSQRSNEGVGESEVKLDSNLLTQIMSPRSRVIPASYKSESPFIQMKKTLLTEKNAEGEFNIPMSGENITVLDSYSAKANNFNSPAVNKSNSNMKTLDLSSLDKSDVTQIINRIANFVESNKISGKNGLDLIVRHEEIGEFKIHTQQSERPGVVDLEIVGQSTKAHQFFSENENKLLQSLDSAGVKLGEFKISGPGHLLPLSNESALSNSNNSSFGNSDYSSAGSNASRFSDAFQGEQGGERRKDLWKQAQEQYNGHYKNFQRKAA